MRRSAFIDRKIEFALRHLSAWLPAHEVDFIAVSLRSSIATSERLEALVSQALG